MRIPSAILALLAAAPAPAAVFTVGADHPATCSHPTVQAAVDAANLNPGPDTIRIARSQLYDEQQIVATTSQDLDFEGGYATCISPQDLTLTRLSGSGGNPAPVLTVNPSGSIRVKLRRLQFTGGDSLPDGGGGGIRVVGRGTLDLERVTVNVNHSGTGGGIYFRGSGPSNSELLIGSDVLISGNQALRDGGGLYIQNAKLTMTAPRSSIWANSADGHGGGIRAFGNLEATISSSGWPGLATIDNNESQRGGGISVQGIDVGGSNAVIRLAGNAAGQPRIANNVAYARGGAVDLQPSNEDDLAFAQFVVDDGVIEDNVSPTGAVVYAANHSDLSFTLGGYVFFEGVRVEGNRSLDSANQPTDGPLIVLSENSYARLVAVDMRGNRGGALVHSGNADSVDLLDGVYVDNALAGSVFDIDDTIDFFRVRGITIAGNTLPAGVPVIAVRDDIDLRRAIVWQPGNPALAAGAKTIDDVLASDTASLGDSIAIVSAPPRFMDPEIGDYRLQAASRAVDFSGIGSGPDLDGEPRGIDLPRVANLSGGGDLGAYERQVLGNLVRNPSFATDLRLWSLGTAGVVATRQASGSDVAGSVTLSRQAVPGGEITGFVQCVRLAGPGVWKLSAKAYGVGDVLTRDQPLLRWRLVPDTGDEQCNGIPAAEGNVAFPGGASWGAAETLIEVQDADFTPRTAIEVQLRVREGNLNINTGTTTTAHFDEIRLEAGTLPPSGLPFADGFE